MKKQTITSFIGLVALGFVLPSPATVAEPSHPSASQEQREERFSREFDIGPNGSLMLTNVSGDIVVRGTAGDRLRVEAVKRVHRARDESDAGRQFEMVDIDVTHTANRVRINTRYGDRDEHDRNINVSVDYRVTAPFGTEVSVQSVSGNLHLEGIHGELEAESVSGEVTVTGAEQLLRVKSVSGDVEVVSSGSTRDVEIASVSGDVDARTLRAPDVKLNSVSGDIDVSDASCERAEMETVSGGVRYSGTLAPSGRYDFKSHSGDIWMSISGDVGFDLEAQSFSGEIESDFPLTVQEMRRERQVRGVFGDGSAVITATTFSGDIDIRQK